MSKLKYVSGDHANKVTNYVEFEQKKLDAEIKNNLDIAKQTITNLRDANSDLNSQIYHLSNKLGDIVDILNSLPDDVKTQLKDHALMRNLLK